MKELLAPKEYRKLLDEKAHLEDELRWFLIKKMPFITHYQALKDMVSLKLKGGPRDLAAKFDYYLYA